MSLRKKLILAVIVSQILIIGVAVFTMLQNEHAILEETLKNAHINYVRLMSNTLLEHVNNGDLQAIDAYTRFVVQEEDVVFVVVQDAAGTLLSTQGDFDEADLRFAETAFGQPGTTNRSYLDELDRRLGSFLHEKGHIYHIAVPLENGGILSGTVVVGVTTEQWNRAVGGNTRQSAWLIGLAVLLAAVAIFADRKLTRAIRNLIVTSGKMADGDLSQKVEIRTGDELEVLGNSFNIMAEKLEISDHALRKSTEELEEEVAVRTEQIETERQMLDRIVGSIGAGLALVNPDLTIAWHNEYFQPGSDRSLSGSDQAKCHMLLWGQHESCIDCATERAFSTGKIERCKRVSKVDEQSRFYTITAAPLTNEQGEVVQVLELVQDETDSKVLEFQLEHSARMAAIGEFSAGIAHEINNPLASVSACAERMGVLLERSSGLEADQKSRILTYLERIEDQVYRVKGITGGLLDFVRVNGDGADLTSVDPGRVIEKVSSLLEFRLSSQRIVTRKEYAPGLYCLADEGQLEQVMLNLVKNSLDAMEGGGELVISTRRHNSRILTAVRDSGDGMDEAQLRRVFNPFYTTKEPGKGTGLGLSICYGIITRMGGEIWAESSPGKGTEFTIALPEADA